MLVRGIEADLLPVAEQYGLGVLPWSPLAGGWLSGRYRKGQDVPGSTRAQRLPQRYDLSRPENQAKLDAADAFGKLADDVGIPLVQLAIAFVMQHPAVTSPIIGPRTMEHLESQLGAVDVRLTADILDRIDEIVPPGQSFSRADAGYVPPTLTDPFSRRRRTA
jgi:aryl-alcohol dehydrogenase-like predicted oxidoreductase